MTTPSLPAAALALFLGQATAVSADACSNRDAVLTTDALTAVTLNIAHGRKDATNQVFLDREEIQQNLLHLARLMDRSGADVIALQEADAPSWWSGDFHHVAYLSEHAAYPCFAHGLHARNRFYDFGTALLSRQPLRGQFVHSFPSSWPTTTKGFTLASIRWNPNGRLERPVDVKFVSVHLDFSRRSVRRAQIEDMTRVLSDVSGPVVLMGDFNTDWETENSSLRSLADALGLAVFEPHAEGLSTYGDKGARLDWILISEPLRFRSYAVFPDVVSDHYAVAAEIEWAEAGQ